jgi:hypothetical protein
MAELVEVKRDRVESVTLRLDADEAEALAALTWHIGGDSYKGPRAAIDRIGTALKEAGIVPREMSGKLGLNATSALWFPTAEKKLADEHVPAFVYKDGRPQRASTGGRGR